MQGSRTVRVGSGLQKRWAKIRHGASPNQQLAPSAGALCAAHGEEAGWSTSCSPHIQRFWHPLR